MALKTSVSPWKRVHVLRGDPRLHTDPLGRWFASLAPKKTFAVSLASPPFAIQQRFPSERVVRWPLAIHPSGRLLAQKELLVGKGSRKKEPPPDQHFVRLRDTDGTTVAEHAAHAVERLAGEALCFSADGRYLWACLQDGPERGRLCLFDGETLALKDSIPWTEPFRELQLSLDPVRPECVVLVDNAGDSFLYVRIFEAQSDRIVETGEKVTETLGRTVFEPVYWAGFSPDGNRFLALNYDRLLTVLSWSDGSVLRDHLTFPVPALEDRLASYRALGPLTPSRGLLWAGLLRVDLQGDSTGPLVAFDLASGKLVHEFAPPALGTDALEPVSETVWALKESAGFTGLWQLSLSA